MGLIKINPDIKAEEKKKVSSSITKSGTLLLPEA